MLTSKRSKGRRRLGCCCHPTWTATPHSNSSTAASIPYDCNCYTDTVLRESTPREAVSRSIEVVVLEVAGCSEGNRLSCLALTLSDET